MESNGRKCETILVLEDQRHEEIGVGGARERREDTFFGARGLNVLDISRRPNLKTPRPSKSTIFLPSPFLPSGTLAFSPLASPCEPRKTPPWHQSSRRVSDYSPSFAWQPASGLRGCVLRRVTCETSERANPLDANHSPGVKIITAINPGWKGRLYGREGRIASNVTGG